MDLPVQLIYFVSENTMLSDKYQQFLTNNMLAYLVLQKQSDTVFLKLNVCKPVQSKGFQLHCSNDKKFKQSDVLMWTF